MHFNYPTVHPTNSNTKLVHKNKLTHPPQPFHRYHHIIRIIRSETENMIFSQFSGFLLKFLSKGVVNRNVCHSYNYNLSEEKIGAASSY